MGKPSLSHNRSKFVTGKFQQSSQEVGSLWVAVRKWLYQSKGCLSGLLTCLSPGPGGHLRSMMLSARQLGLQSWARCWSLPPQPLGVVAVWECHLQHGAGVELGPPQDLGWILRVSLSLGSRVLTSSSTATLSSCQPWSPSGSFEGVASASCYHHPSLSKPSHLSGEELGGKSLSVGSSCCPMLPIP